jgi:hypothetical protein
MRILAAVAVMAFTASLASAAEVDLSKIPRSINKEPAYKAKDPKYALAVFGPEAKTRVWLVLDKSKPDAKNYDVLYADLNANGDLTEANERFAPDDGDAAESKLFKLPDFVDPLTKEKHTDVTLHATESRSINILSLRWNGKHKLGGGYPVDPDKGYMSFGPTPQEAPILWFNGGGPFRFQRWINAKSRIGEETDIRLFLGTPGLGRNTFCAFQEHVLPAEEGVSATLIYQDKNGKEQRAICELKERC